VNTSTAKLKSKGDKGSPYLRPFPCLKYELFSSLILIEIDPPPPLTRESTYSIHFFPKPR
jgi:hypothetical protein